MKGRIEITSVLFAAFVIALTYMQISTWIEVIRISAWIEQINTAIVEREAGE